MTSGLFGIRCSPYATSSSASIVAAQEEEHYGHDSDKDGKEQDELGRHRLHRVVYSEDRSRQLSSSPREAAGYDVPPNAIYAVDMPLAT
jgi:hypothetical protein